MLYLQPNCFQIINRLILRRMKHFTILFFSLITWFSTLSARTIQGSVLSSFDSTAVAGASCKVLLGDKFITGSQTATDGEFSLSTDLKSALKLEISMTGYAATTIIIEAGSKNLNVGTVYLDEALNIDEVTVTANQVIHSKGRTIVYPSGADVKASATSISLFQKLPLPGLEANPINRSLSVDGGAPMILINGVPSTIEDVQALLPKDIEKIEYSRVTPARYADKGTSGLINITLKKRSDGGQFYLWGRSALNTTFVDGNIRTSYHQGPSQFTLSYNPSWRNYKDVFDHTVESYIGDDFRVNLESRDRNPFNYHYHQMRLKYDYSPSTKTLFSATFTATPSYNTRRSYANTIDSELGKYDNTNMSKSKDFAPSLDLFLRQDFNDKNSLEVQVVGTLSSSDYRRDNNYFFDDNTEESYIMNVDSRRQSLISEVSYIHNFSDNTQLSGGYQNTVSHSTNTYLSSDYKPVLTENNNYVYARLGQTIGKVYLSASTGLKMFWINNGMNKRKFIRNISTVQASWRISPKWNIASAFMYSPAIPSLTSLTDYPQQTTPYLISNGNPNLKVAENCLVQLMPSLQYKKFNTSLLMNYRTIHNFVMSDVTYLGDKLFLSQSINARKSWMGWASLNMRISDIKGFGANVTLGATHSETMGNGWCHVLNSFEANFSLWWNKGPYTISYWRKIPGKYLSGTYVSKQENGDMLEFEYQPDKHWTLGLGWWYMFDKKGTRYPSWNYSQTNPMSIDRYIKNNSNMVVLSVTYNTNFGSIFRTGRRNLNNSDNGSSLLKM